MIRRRTILLLALMVASGALMGVLSSFEDGLYTAICLFMFPFLIALMFLAIGYDVVNPPPRSLRREPAGQTGRAVRPAIGRPRSA